MSNLPSDPSKGEPSARSLWFARISVFAVTFGTVFTVHLRLTGNPFSPELQASMAVLLFNYLLFLMMLQRKGPDFLGGHLGFGLLLLTTKLFVNTFTIFIFIGLHAGRTHVFVWQFIGAYTLLLFGSVLLLARKP